MIPTHRIRNRAQPLRGPRDLGAALVGNDRRKPGGHRLHHDLAEGVVVAREDEEVGTPVGGGQLPAGECSRELGPSS